MRRSPRTCKTGPHPRRSRYMYINGKTVFSRSAIDPPGWEPQHGKIQDLITVQLKILMRPRAVVISVGESDSFLCAVFRPSDEGVLDYSYFRSSGSRVPPLSARFFKCPPAGGVNAYPAILKVHSSFTAPSLYYPVQRGYAQDDSQEYSKGFDRRLRIDKTQTGRTEYLVVGERSELF